MNTTNTWPVLMKTLPTLPPWVIALGTVVIVWFVVATVLKCYVLWHSARRGEKWWFIGLFFINTLGVLELIYLARHRMSSAPPATPSTSKTWQ